MSEDFWSKFMRGAATSVVSVLSCLHCEKHVVVEPWQVQPPAGWRAVRWPNAATHYFCSDACAVLTYCA